MAADSWSKLLFSQAHSGSGNLAWRFGYALGVVPKNLEKFILDDNLVCFAHGKESGPWGTKIKVLAEIAQQRGFLVQSPDFRMCPGADERIGKLIAAAPSARRALVLVGSSMGAYVTLSAARRLNPAGLFLMAPALYLPGYESVEAPPDNVPIRVIHGWHDDVVPTDYAIRFARKYDVELTLLNAGHSLVEALPVIGELFATFLDRVRGRRPL